VVRRDVLQYPLKDDFGGGGGGGGGSAAPVSANPSDHARDIPRDFQDEMAVIQRWAEGNEREAKRDLLRFWILKLPAILVTAAAALFAYFHVDVASIVASSIAALCIMVDAVRPAGMMYKAHRRAANEIYKLHADMASKFRVGNLANRDLSALAGEILADSKSERDRIAKYLTDAESALQEPSTPLT
jgi:hypothetical protein